MSSLSPPQPVPHASVSADLAVFDPYTLIPKPPTAADIEIPHSPRPPDLTSIDPETGVVSRDQIIGLIQAYRALIAHKGLKTFVYSRGKLPSDITKIKDYGVLDAGYRALLEHEIAPHPWCSFQFNAFNHARSAAGEPSRVPLIGYVYNPEHIEKRRGWYRSERTQHCLIRNAVPEALTQLRATYAEMEAEIGATPMKDRTREFYADLRVRYFPGKAYSSALSQAKMQAALSRQAMQDELKNEGWVWE